MTLRCEILLNRWLSAGLSLSRSHHCVQSLSLCLYTGVTTLHRGTIPIATVLHSATEMLLNNFFPPQKSWRITPCLMNACVRSVKSPSSRYWTKLRWIFYINFYDQPISFGLSINPTVHLKYTQAFLRALKSPPHNCVRVIWWAFKSINVNECSVNSNTLLKARLL